MPRQKRYWRSPPAEPSPPLPHASRPWTERPKLRALRPADVCRIGRGSAAVRLSERSDDVSFGKHRAAVLQRHGDNDVRMLRHGDYDAVRGAGGLGGNRRRRNVLLGTWSQLANLRDLWRRVDARRGHRADLAQGDRDVRVGHVVRAVLAGGWR